jgi:hypothetical protein
MREYASDTNLIRLSQKVLTPVHQQQHCYQQYSTISVATNRSPVVCQQSAAAINISCFTAGTASTVSQQPQTDPQKKPQAMLFTNYLQKDKKDEHYQSTTTLQAIPPLQLENTLSSTTEHSQISKNDLPLTESNTSREHKVLRVKEVESEYAESANGETSRKMVQRTSKFVSKLERYIAQPSKAIESLIVKDPRHSNQQQQHRPPAAEPTGLHKAARFAKSVFGEHSQQLRH